MAADYVEQTLAGWQSAKEQTYDMGQHQRFFPLNCRRTHALVFEHIRSYEPGNRFELDLIERANPALLEWPCNPPDSSFGSWQILRARTKHDPAYPARRGRALIESLFERIRLRINRH